MSVAPPAGKPTMMRTGRDGQACARAMREAAGNAAAPAARLKNVRRRIFMMLPPQSAARVADARNPAGAQWEQTMPDLWGGGSGFRRHEDMKRHHRRTSCNRDVIIVRRPLARLLELSSYLAGGPEKRTGALCCENVQDLAFEALPTCGHEENKTSGEGGKRRNGDTTRGDADTGVKRVRVTECGAHHGRS